MLLAQCINALIIIIIIIIVIVIIAAVVSIFGPTSTRAVHSPQPVKLRLVYVRERERVYVSRWAAGDGQ